jgi:hypothetical protein
LIVHDGQVASAPDMVNINASVSNTPPTVSLSAPLANQRFTAPATMIVSADATDSDGQIAAVTFYQGSTPIGTVSSAPYRITWSPSSGRQLRIEGKRDRRWRRDELVGGGIDHGNERHWRTRLLSAQRSSEHPADGLRRSEPGRLAQLAAFRALRDEPLPRRTRMAMDRPSP